jgi:hypothetical protein
MEKLTQKQIIGFAFAFLLIIFGFIAVMFNKEPNVWGSFLGVGAVAFIITLFPKHWI